MRPLRLRLFGAALAASIILAYFLRDVVYELLVVPLAYCLWLAQLLYLAIPQLVKWVVLLILLFIGVLWKLLPVAPAAPRREADRRRLEGPVESLASGIHRSSKSNYFKWQLAHRLGRLDRRILDASMRPEGLLEPSEAVRQFLAAGRDQSFVDFPTPARRFRRRAPTALDADPQEVIHYLELQMESSHGSQP
jgi:hypothetical protein